MYRSKLTSPTYFFVKKKPSIWIASDDTNVIALVSGVGTLPNPKTFHRDGLGFLFSLRSRCSVCVAGQLPLFTKLNRRRLVDSQPVVEKMLIRDTLPETNSKSILKMDGWNIIFLLGNPIFRGYVSFREGIFNIFPTSSSSGAV